MFQVKRGRIKFFRQDKGYGFITPDNGGPDVFFHAANFNWPTEGYLGEMKLDEWPDFIPPGYQSTHHYRIPVPANKERVMYIDHEGKKGLAALYWCYAEWWDEAQEVIDARSEPDNPLIKVERSWGHAEVQLVWEGDYRQYREKLDQGFPEMWEPFVNVRILRATGWDYSIHPNGFHSAYKDIPGDWTDCSFLVEQLRMSVRNVHDFFQGSVRVDDDPEAPISQRHCPALGIGLRLREYTPPGGMPSSHFKMPLKDAEVLVARISEFCSNHSVILQ